MLNILTIDVEDYFQVNAFSKCIRYDDWGTYECRVERNTHRLLEILHDFHPRGCSVPSSPVRATFFVLGWIAERYPNLIGEINEQGHEIASHGYNHQIISSMSPGQFREDIRRSKAILEDLTGKTVLGYRAPTYSIGQKQLWALKTLAEEGYRYDSSIFPIRHDTYGIPDAPRFPFAFVFGGDGEKESIIEFPLSSTRLFNMNLPVSGGGYFRLLPYQIIKRALRRINRQEEQPFIFYLHPWEIDPEQPRIAGACIKSKFRHYVNLDKTERAFKKLLQDFQFSCVRDVAERNRNLLTKLRIAHSQGSGLIRVLEDRRVLKWPKWVAEGEL